MVAKTASSLPFSIFPRFGFAPSHRTESSSLSPHAEKPDEDWYIPYNGPFEPPKNVSMPKQDSSGGYISQDDTKVFLEDSRLLDRYGNMSVDAAGTVGLGPPPAESNFPRDRLRSDLTRRTTSSSSAIDPTLLRSQASVPRLQVLTYVSTDASGDVGASPMPMHRTTLSAPQKRTSRFFGFGTSKKPRGQSISTPGSPSRVTVSGAWLPSSIQHSTIQDNVGFAKYTGSSPSTDDHFDSHYSIFRPPSPSSNTLHHQLSVDNANRSPSKRHHPRYLDQLGTSDQDPSVSSPAMNYNSPTLPAHPYANTSSSVSLHIPHATTSGLAFRTDTSHQGHQRQDSGSHYYHSQNPTHRGRTLTYAIDPHMHRAAHTRPMTPKLKSSISTPNLSEAALGKRPAQQRTKSPPPATGFDRWLSAETWCDALFFPRPRLKVKGSHGRYGGSSGRIVSPPVTPISEDAPPRLSPAILGGRPRVLSATHDAPRRRVLSKSRSTDVLSGPSISRRPRTAPTSQRRRDPDTVPEINLKDPEPVPDASTVPQQELRPSSPVPSLTQVLEEGEALAEQRKQWQSQASRSLGNSRTRSLSRARAKSLSRSHGRPGQKQDGSTALEFLAARTLLGGQSIAPTVNSTSHSRSYSNSHTTLDSRSRSNSYSFSHSHSHSHSHSYSHSHSHSLGNASTRSLTDPRSTRHARNESWSKTALLKVCAPCGDRSDLCGSPVGDKTFVQEPGTEDNNGCDERDVVVIKAASPVPSTHSGEGIGIALSSPPSSADHSRPIHGLEETSMSDHPYAKAVIYTRYYNPSSAGENALQHSHKVSDYAGPHLSAYDPQLSPNTASGVSMRHRLPPRAMQPGAISHPYAVAFSKPPSSHSRQPSNIILPTPPVPPSVVQEGKDFTSNHHISISSPDFGKYGVGEALVFAAPSRDEQDIDSEDQPLGIIIPPQQGTLDRIVDIGKAKERAPPKGSRSRPPSVTLIVSTRPPSPTATEGRDSAHPQLSLTTNISSAHLVISALDNNDDLEEFQDLFYKPPQCTGQHKEASDTSRGIPSDIHSSCSGSALTNLVRSLNEEIGELHIAASDISLGQQSGGPCAQRSDEISQSYVFMDMSRTPSPGSVNGPPTVLRLPSQHYDAPFESGVPEDIGSSRASSLLMTEENDTFGHPIRQGLVDAAGISTILQCPSRATSTHPEIQDDIEEADAISPISYFDSQLHSPDAVRSSYMTSASEYSRMSALSDFPVPPTRPDFAPVRTSIFEICADLPSTQQPENPPETEFSPRPESCVINVDSRRTTFGGSDDKGHYTGARV